MITTQQALTQKTLSLAAAGVLAVTACAWGISNACKTQRESSSTATSRTTSTSTNLSHKS